MMFQLLAQSYPVDLISLFSNPKTIIGGISAVVFIFCVYFLFPTFKEYMNVWINKKTLENKEATDSNVDFRKWLMLKTDKLEEERERRIDRVEFENRDMRNKIDKLQLDLAKQSGLYDDTRQRLNNLEWVFLGEICDEMIAKIIQQKEIIAYRLRKVGHEELADVVQEEFEKIIEGMRATFLVRHVERTKSIVEKNT